MPHQASSFAFFEEPVVFVGYIHEKAGQCQVFCVNLSPSFSRLGYPRFSRYPTALLSGGYTRGRQPSCGGSRQHRCMLACFLLAGSVLPAWGEPAPPRLALGGNRERGIEFLAAAGHFCHADAVARRATLESEDMAGWLFLAPGSLFVGSHYLASIRTIFRASF